MIPTTMAATRPEVSAQGTPAPLDQYSLTGKAEVAPTQTYQNMLLGMTGFQSGGRYSKTDPYAQVQRFLGPSGVGYHLPVAALQGDQIWNDSFRQPYVGPLDFDNWGFGQPIETFEMRRQYRELYRKEPSIRSAVDGMTESVAVLDVSVLPQDPRSDWDCQAAEYLGWTVENTLLGWDGLITQTAKPAIIDGYAALEKVLNDQLVTEEQSRQWEDKWQLLHCRPLDTFWIKLQVDQFRNVLNVVNTVRGLQYYNIDKVLLFSHASLYGNPFGQSSLRACIRAANIIQDAYQLWYLALKMFGLPYLYGQYKNANQKEMMINALAQMRAGGFAVSSTEDDIKILSLAGAANFSAFEQAINKLREDNYLAIRGAYLPFLEGTGSPDSRGNTMVSKVASDAKSELLANQLGRLYTHQLGPWVVHDNFPRGTGYPIVVIGGTNWEETAKTLNVGLTLSKEFGLPLSKHQLYKRGGWSPPDNEADDTVDYNAIQARAQLMQGQVQLQLQAASQQQQLAAQAQAAQLQGAAGGGQNSAGGGGGQPPGPGGGGGGPLPSGGGNPSGGGSDFTVQAEPFSEGAKRTEVSKFAEALDKSDLEELPDEPWDDGTVIKWYKSPFPVLKSRVELPKGKQGKDAPIREVSLNDLQGTQSRVTDQGLDKPDDNSEGLPLVVKSNGVEYIQDGHHRLTKMVISGKTKAKVRYLNLDENGKSASEVTPSQFAALAQSIMAEQGMMFADPQPRRGRVTPTYSDLVTHAAAAMDNPLDNTAGMAFADHLAESHPDQPAVQEFQNWVQGGDWGSLGRELAMHSGGYEPRGGYPSLDRSLDAPDFELKPRRSDTQEPKLSTYSYGKRLDEPTWHLRVPSYGSEHGISTRRMARRKPLSTAEVANAIYQARGPSELIKAYLAARHFHPDNPKGAMAPGDGTLAGRTRPVFSENVSMEAFASDWTKLDRHPGTGRWHKPGTLSEGAAPSLSSPSKASSSSLSKDKFADDTAPRTLDTSHFENSPPTHTQSEFHHTIVHTPEDKTAAGVYADWLQDQDKDAHAEVVRGHGQREGMGRGTMRLAYHPQELANFVPGQFYVSPETHYPKTAFGTPTRTEHYVALHQLSEAPHTEDPRWRHLLQWQTPTMSGADQAALLQRLVAEGAMRLPKINHGAGLEHLPEGPVEEFADPTPKPAFPRSGPPKPTTPPVPKPAEPEATKSAEPATSESMEPEVKRTGVAPVVKRGVFGRLKDWALSKQLVGSEQEQHDAEQRQTRELGAKNVAERNKRLADKAAKEVKPVRVKAILDKPPVGYDPEYTPTTRADRTVTPGSPKPVYRPLPQAKPIVKPGVIVDTTKVARKATAALEDVNTPETPTAPGIPTAANPVIKPLPKSVAAPLPPLKLPGQPVQKPASQLPADDTGLPVGNEVPAPTNRVPPLGETAKTPPPAQPTPASPNSSVDPEIKARLDRHANAIPQVSQSKTDEIMRRARSTSGKTIDQHLGVPPAKAYELIHEAVSKAIQQAVAKNDGRPVRVPVTANGKTVVFKITPNRGGSNPKQFAADSASGWTGFSVEYAFDDAPLPSQPHDDPSGATPHDYTRQQFEKAIDANPLDAINHLVYADHLDELGEHDEAAFRRAMGEWVTQTGKNPNEFKKDRIESPFWVNPDRTRNSPHRFFSHSIHRDDLPEWSYGLHHAGSYPENRGGRDISDDSVAYRPHRDGRYFWTNYRNMETGLRNAFMANRRGN